MSDLIDSLSKLTEESRPKPPSWGAAWRTEADVSEGVVRMCAAGWTVERALERVYNHPRLRQLMHPELLKERERYRTMREEKKTVGNG